MKYAFVISALLFTALTYGQTRWVQIRKSSFNHNVDEWVRHGDTLAIAKDTFWKHDTIYLLKPQYDSMFATKSNKILTINYFDSTLFLGPIWTSRGGRLFFDDDHNSRGVRKKKRKKKPVRHQHVKLDNGYFVSPCNADTVRGILCYNNRELEVQGNIAAPGYWVGCGVNFFHAGPFTFIAGRGKRTELYVDTASVSIKKRTVGYYAGKFFTDDGEQIPNYLVYQLIIQ